jgi:hypothetical protein
VTNQITKKDVSYETTITLTTSCVFLTTNSIASIYVYIKSSNRSNRTRATEDLKTSHVYLILRMLTLLDTVLEFYIYFLTGKKFRDEVYHVIREILQHTPLKNYFKFTPSSSTIRTTDISNRRKQIHNKQQQSNKKYILTQLSKTDDSWIESTPQKSILNIQYYDNGETLDRIESTV